MAATKSSETERDLAELKVNIDVVTGVISQLQSLTRSSNSESTSEKSQTATTNGFSDDDPLSLSYNAAKLLKAHSTKISLLIINKPFTPTAISTVLREIAAGPLPALATAVVLCDDTSYTRLMAKELRWNVHNVFTEFTNLVREIPLTGEILSTAQKNGATSDSAGNKGSLASTGVLWKACDDLMAIKGLGIIGLVVRQAENYRAMLQDAMEELQEWGEEKDEDNDSEEDAHSEYEEEVDAAQKAIDDIFANQRHIPRDDTQKIRSRLELTLKRIKLITLMITAVIKRRFRVLSPTPLPAKNVMILDDILEVMKKLTDITDELANGFYELDVVEIERRMDELFLTGFAAAEYMLPDWKGKEDEFTEWVCNFYRQALKA